MFEPELFGLTAAQFREIALSLLTASLGFAFLYLMALPLKKLPFIDDIEDYKPPSWVLPVFACGSLFITSFCVSSSLFVSSMSASPNKQAFVNSYHKLLPDIDFGGKKLLSAHAVVDAYDGRSNFRIFVNGYRVFSTTANCRLNFQCLPEVDQGALSAYKQFTDLHLNDWTVNHFESPFSLPYEMDITGFLAEGDNFIDVHADNSWAMTCNLAVSVVMTLSDGKQKAYTVTTTPEAGSPTEAGKPTISKPDSQSTVYRFKSGGDPSAADRIPVYLTNTANQSWRLCERIRFRFALTKMQLPDILNDSDQLTKWYATRFERW